MTQAVLLAAIAAGFTPKSRWSDGEMDFKIYADSIVNTLREPLLVLDEQHRVLAASPSFYRRFEVTKEQTLGFSIYELGNSQWNIAGLPSSRLRHAPSRAPSGADPGLGLDLP